MSQGDTPSPIIPLVSVQSPEPTPRSWALEAPHTTTILEMEPLPPGGDDPRLAGLGRVQLTQIWSEPRNEHKVLSLIPGGEEVETEKKESTKTSRTFRGEKCNCAI